MNNSCVLGSGKLQVVVGMCALYEDRFVCGSTHCCVEAVRHELALAIRGDERDGPVVLKARQTDALMKLHVFQLHCLALLSCHNTHKQKDLTQS